MSPAAPPARCDVAVVGGTVSDADTLEIYDLACGLVAHAVHTLTLVVPYFGYGTMDRPARPGEVVTAKTRARLISSIPTAGSGNRIVLLDLHTAGIQHYFSGLIRPVHLQARDRILEAARRLGGDEHTEHAVAASLRWLAASQEAAALAELEEGKIEEYGRLAALRTYVLAVAGGQDGTGPCVPDGRSMETLVSPWRHATASPNAQVSPGEAHRRLRLPLVRWRRQLHRRRHRRRRRPGSSALLRSNRRRLRRHRRPRPRG